MAMAEGMLDGPDVGGSAISKVIAKVHSTFSYGKCLEVKKVKK